MASIPLFPRSLPSLPNRITRLSQLTAITRVAQPSFRVKCSPTRRLAQQVKTPTAHTQSSCSDPTVA